MTVRQLRICENRRNQISRIVIAFFFIVATGLQSSDAAAGDSDFLSAAINLRLEDRLIRVTRATDKQRLTEIKKFYAANSYQPIWTNLSGAMPKAHALVAALQGATRHGLLPSDYDKVQLSRRLGALGTIEIAALEIDLSQSFIEMAQDLATGRIDPERAIRRTYLDPKAPLIAELLSRAAATSDVAAYLNSMAPRIEQYQRLINAMANYRRLAKQMNLQPVPNKGSLRRGDQSARVAGLRRRLTLFGDLLPLPVVPDEESQFDEMTEAAVKRFQRRHGLLVDGIAGRKTLAELNASFRRRALQIEINLERWRWLRQDLGSHYVITNIADQRLTLIKDNKAVFASKIVVGKTYHATPVFTDRMTYLVLNPYWNVPRSIAVGELLPKLKRDPRSVGRRGIRAISGRQVIHPAKVNWSRYNASHFPLRLRQNPGPTNALGRIKFMFPNKYNIYIHDTPARHLFARNRRTFSHGCMRVQDPAAFAAALLDGEGWTRATIDARLATNKRHVISLERQLPVYITYMTAWVDERGDLQFRPDIYSRDRRLAKALGLAALGTR